MGDKSFAEIHAKQYGPRKVAATIGWEGVHYADLDGNVLFTLKRPEFRETRFTEDEAKSFADQQSWAVVTIIHTNHLD